MAVARPPSFAGNGSLAAFQYNLVAAKMPAAMNASPINTPTGEWTSGSTRLCPKDSRVSPGENCEAYVWLAPMTPPITAKTASTRSGQAMTAGDS